MTIDFEAATVTVNWDRDKLENLPFGRACLRLST